MNILCLVWKIFIFSIWIYLANGAEFALLGRSYLRKSNAISVLNPAYLVNSIWLPHLSCTLRNGLGSYSLPLSKWKSPHLINSSVFLSFCSHFLFGLVPKFLEFWKTECCVWAFLLRMENGFVPRAEGPWFWECPYATFRFPFGTFVFRRNTKVEILYQARAEGPWFVGAGRRLFVDICTIESGRDPTNYYLYFYDTVPNPSIGHIEHDSHQYAQWMLK